MKQTLFSVEPRQILLLTQKNLLWLMLRMKDVKHQIQSVATSTRSPTSLPWKFCSPRHVSLKDKLKKTSKSLKNSDKEASKALNKCEN